MTEILVHEAWHEPREVPVRNFVRLKDKTAQCKVADVVEGLAAASNG